MDIRIKKELVDYLSGYVTENKKEKIGEVIANRTKHVSVVLENIFHPHNASAIVRSAECFGVQDIHLIEKGYEFKATLGITKGSSKWVDFHKYSDTALCVKTLKENGYKIVATTPHKTSRFLHEISLEKKVAFLFGTELEGLSQEAMGLSDEFVTIPMFGFTESFNISVSVAVCLYDVTKRLRSSSLDWRLSEEEMLDVMLRWIKKIAPGAEAMERKFLQDKGL